MAQYVTDFLHHGKNCRRVLVEPKREFVVGVDLGQMADNTTVAIVQYMRMGTGEFDVHGIQDVEQTSFQKGGRGGQVVPVVRRSHSRRASLRSSQAMRLYWSPGFRRRKAGWNVGTSTISR